MAMDELIAARSSNHLRPSSGDLIEAFELDCGDRGLGKETSRRYISATNIFSRYLNDRGIPLLSVDGHVLRDFIRFRRFQGIKQKTMENDLSAISALYDYICFDGYMQSNPVPPIRKRFLKKYKSDTDDLLRKLISVEDMAKLVNSVLNPRDRALILLLAKTGVRRGELISMDVDDIDWVEQSITLKPKRKRTGRVVFFDDECAIAMKRWLKAREEFKPNNNALFIGPGGERLKRHGVYSIVCKHAEKVGLHNPESPKPEDHFTPHCFRHWFTTWLRRDGMPREFIQELRGDRRREAIDIYDHIGRAELRKAYLACIPQLGI
jgi:integrase/recombinase XerD